MKRRGFTLVEVLVVIIVLCVLAGLIIPAVMAARDMANRPSTPNRAAVEQLHSGAINIYQVTVDGETYYLAESNSPIIQLRSVNELKLEKE